MVYQLKGPFWLSISRSGMAQFFCQKMGWLFRVPKNDQLLVGPNSAVEAAGPRYCSLFGSLPEAVADWGWVKVVA